MTARHPLRVTGRLLWFAGIVLAALSDYLVSCAFRSKRSKLIARAHWLQRHSRRTLRMLQLEPCVEGAIPTHGLLVSNHLGYLDVLVLSAITPAIFVAKREIKFWPVIGLLTSLAGTLFVNRERRSQVGQTNNEIQATLDSGMLMVLFAEGTSSNGQDVLPFKSALLEPVVQQTHPISVACIQYALDDNDGDAGEEVCYWGGHTFFPHLLNLLSKRAVRAEVKFAVIPQAGADRKELARQLRGGILKLKDGCVS
jgi:1-acyl-sn-glycerol-3-phosphate acyltransferase